MIVVDTNTLVYLWVPSPRQTIIESLLRIDSNWIAPTLWKSEFRNTLATYMRAGFHTLDQTLIVMAKAEEFMANHEKPVNSSTVLRLSNQSKCTTYDCEFVALAIEQEVPLITHDKKMLSQFPSICMTADQFLALKS